MQFLFQPVFVPENSNKKSPHEYKHSHTFKTPNSKFWFLIKTQILKQDKNRKFKQDKNTTFGFHTPNSEKQICSPIPITMNPDKIDAESLFPLFLLLFLSLFFLFN